MYPSLTGEDGADGEPGAGCRSGWLTAWRMPGRVWAVVLSWEMARGSTGVWEARRVTGQEAFMSAGDVSLCPEWMFRVDVARGSVHGSMCANVLMVDLDLPWTIGSFLTPMYSSPGGNK